MLNEENTTRHFPSFRRGDGVQKLVGSMADDQALAVWELHTLEDMRWNNNHQHLIKYWSRDIIKCMRWLMQWPAYAKYPIYAPEWCFISNMPLRHLHTAMHTAGWWRQTQDRRDRRGWWHTIGPWVNAESGEYTGSVDLHVQRNTTLKFCWWQERVACIYDIWQSIIEHPPDALNAHHRKGWSPADSHEELQYSLEAAGWAAANKPRCAERGTPAGNPASHHWTKSLRRERISQCSLCRWQHRALQTCSSSIAFRLPRV